MKPIPLKQMSMMQLDAERLELQAEVDHLETALDHLGHTQYQLHPLMDDLSEYLDAREQRLWMIEWEIMKRMKAGQQPLPEPTPPSLKVISST